MKKRATLADVARAAGVSLMTVSRAINDKPGLSDELREKIMTLVDEMEFIPNLVARGLATSQTRTVALVVPDISNPFFAQITRGLEDTAYGSDYNVILINTAEDAGRERKAFDLILRQGINGVVLCSPRLPMDTLSTLIQRFPATVLFNRELKNPLPGVVTINVNDQRGAQKAIEYFLHKNHRRIAYIAGPGNSVSSQRRLEGYRASLKEAEIPYEPQMVEACQPTTEGGRTAAAALLARRPEIDAILAFNDLVAVGALQICQEAGKSIPAQVAIIGADDIPLATIIRPQLTTLHINLGHIGRLAFRTLVELINEDTSPASFQIEPELIIRDTA